MKSSHGYKRATLTTSAALTVKCHLSIFAASLARIKLTEGSSEAVNFMHQNSLPHYVLEQTDVGVNKLFLGTYSPIIQLTNCMKYIYKSYRSGLCRFLTNITNITQTFVSVKNM